MPETDLQFVIQKRGDKWCLLTSDKTRVLGCHPSKAAAEAQERAVQARKHMIADWITAEAMADICGICAQEMVRDGIEAVSTEAVFAGQSGFDGLLARLEELIAEFEKALKDGDGAASEAERRSGEFSEDFREHLGKADPGFFTRCMGHSFGKTFRNKKAFCAWLHHRVLGTWPSVHRKGHAGDGEPVVFDDETHSLRGVEIFQTGTHKGKPYTEKDLDAIAAAYPQVGFRPALKVDTGGGRPTHAGGGPAYGYVSALRRVGAKLVADFVNIPRQIYEFIRRKAFDRVSVELYRNMQRNGVTYPLVLGAVELLGASIPAVPGLKPVSESIGLSEVVFESMDVFTIPFGEAPMPDTKEQEYQEKIKKLQEDLKAAQEKAETINKEAEKLKAEAEGNAESAKEQAEKFSQELASLKEERRQERVKSIVDSLRIPALRKYLEAFVTLASKAGDEKVTFAIGEKDGKPDEKEVTYMVIAEHFRDYANHVAEKNLFSEWSVAEETAKEEGPDTDGPLTADAASDKLAALTEKKIAEKPDLDFTAAYEAVKAEHPDLVAALKKV